MSSDRERPLPEPKKWTLETETTYYGWQKPKLDRGYGKDQFTLHDLEDFVFPHVKNFRSAVQAGGGLGMWSAKMAEHFDNVYTFEPNHELFRCMQLNLPEPNIWKYQAALGFDRGCRDMSWGFSRNNYGGYYVEKEGPVPTMRVDDLGLENCDLLMLDVEGAEFDALRGSFNTVNRGQPVIVLEWKPHTLCRFGANEKRLREWLDERGYSFKCDFHNGKDQLWLPRS